MISKKVTLFFAKLILFHGSIIRSRLVYACSSHQITNMLILIEWNTRETTMQLKTKKLCKRPKIFHMKGLWEVSHNLTKKSKIRINNYNIISINKKKNNVKFIKPDSRNVFETIKRAMKLTHKWSQRMKHSWRWLHINILFQISMKKYIIDIHLM